MVKGNILGLMADPILAILKMDSGIKKDLISLPHGCTDSLKIVYIEILIIFVNDFRSFQDGVWKFLSGIVFLNYLVCTIMLFLFTGQF